MTTVEHFDNDLQRIPMSWEEFLQRDHPVQNEYYGGCLVVMAPAGKRHQQIIKRLERLVDAAVPAGAEALQSLGWSPRGVEEYLVPDLVVFRDEEDVAIYGGTPLLVVEVVSTNRRDDLMAKVQRYAAWGAPSYWIVDPRDHLVQTLELRDGIFVESGRFTAGEATLRYGDVEVSVDIDALLV